MIAVMNTLHVPSVPDEGDGRMYALGSLESLTILVLSPKMAPPVRADDGSTACEESTKIN